MIDAPDDAFATVAAAQHEAAGQARSFFRALGVSSILLVAVGFLCITVENRAIRAEAKTLTVVDGTVVAGRGLAPENGEVQVEHLTANGTVVRHWAPVRDFGPYQVGSNVEVVYVTANPDEIRLEQECECGPESTISWPLLLLILAVVFVRAPLPLLSMRAASKPTGLDRGQPGIAARVWWSSPWSTCLRIYEADDTLHPDSLRPVGLILLDPAYRRTVPNGAEVTLLGEVAPGSKVALRVGGATVTPSSRLREPKQYKADHRPPDGPSTGPGGIRLEVDPVLAGKALGSMRVGTALIPLLGLLLFAGGAEPPWNGLVYALALTPVLFVVIRSTVLSIRAVTAGSTRPASPAPPEPWTWPGMTNRAGKPKPPRRQDLRTLGTGSSWVLLTGPLLLMAILNPILLAMALVIVIGTVVRMTRPVTKRYRRPALPLWLASAAVLASTTGSVVFFDRDGVGFSAALKAAGLLTCLGFGLLAWRLVASGVTVGERAWVVHGLRRTTRIPSSEVTALTLGHGGVFAPQLLVHRRVGDSIRVPWLAVSAADARRSIEAHSPPPTTPPNPTLPLGPYART